MRAYLLFIFFTVIFESGFAQQTDTTQSENNNEEGVFVIPDNNEPLKIGIKFGLGSSDMLGTEISNATLCFGLQGSAFVRYRFKPRLAVQSEFGASFRGSNFNANTDGYNSIKAYYFDLPVIVVLGFNKESTSNLVAGFQYSYLLNASMYKYGASLPEPDIPGLKKHDLMAIVGSQFYTPFVGFQFLFKYGLLDINEGQPWPGQAKPDNKGGSIHNFSAELNFLF